MTSPEQLAGPDRSRRLFGAEVIDVDGAKVGTVSQVFLDDDTDQPRWVSIRTGRFGTSESLVPLQGAEINGDRIRVQYDKATISGAPRSDGGQPLSRDDEGELYRHYHRDSPARHAPAGDAAVDGRTGDERGVDRPGVDSPGVDGPGLVEWAAKDDGSMVRSEEQLAVRTERVAAGQARVRKFLITEEQQITVSVSREDVRIEYVTDADLGSNDVQWQGSSAVGAPTTGSPAAASSTTGVPPTGVPPTDSPVADSPVAASSTTGASRGRQIDRPLRDHDLAGDGGHTAANGDEWVVLYAQRPVVTMEWVPVERVRIGTIEVAGQETVSGEVRKERVEVLGDVPDVGLEAAGGPSGSR